MKKKRLILAAVAGLNFLAVSCKVSTDCDTPAVTTLADIQTRVFNQSCRGSGCHVEAGADAGSGLDLSPGKAYTSLVNVNSSANPAFKRVKPGDSANSWLIKKLRNDDDIIGDRMPLSGAPLSEAMIADIAEWIDNGANP